MKAKKKIKWEDINGYLFLLVPLAVYIIFFITPNFSALVNSFYEWDGISPTKTFVGFNNFIHMLGDRIFKLAFGNTIKYMLTLLIFQTSFGLLLALLIQKNTKTNGFFRTVYYLPVMMASVTIGLIWTFIYDPNFGALNELLRILGLGNLTRSWLSDKNIAIYAIAFVHVWLGIGQSTVLFIGGLQNIPTDVYESAQMDGAGRMRTLFSITLPLLRPTLLLVMVLTTISGFMCFDFVFIMTGGGAGHSSEVLSTLLYTQAYKYSNFGYSAAISVALLIIVAILSFLQNKLLGNKDGIGE